MSSNSPLEKLAREAAIERWPVIETPNGQPITAVRVSRGGRVLLVHTRSRVYYLDTRRKRLRLWKRT